MMNAIVNPCIKYIPSSESTPSSLSHSVTTITLHYLRPLRSIIAPSIHSSSGELSDSRSISISVTTLHSGHTFFISQAAFQRLAPFLYFSKCHLYSMISLYSFHFVPTIHMLFSLASFGPCFQLDVVKNISRIMQQRYRDASDTRSTANALII